MPISVRCMNITLSCVAIAFTKNKCSVNTVQDICRIYYFYLLTYFHHLFLYILKHNC